MLTFKNHNILYSISLGYIFIGLLHFFITLYGFNFISFERVDVVNEINIFSEFVLIFFDPLIMILCLYTYNFSSVNFWLKAFLISLSKVIILIILFYSMNQTANYNIQEYLIDFISTYILIITWLQFQKTDIEIFKIISLGYFLYLFSIELFMIILSWNSLAQISTWIGFIVTIIFSGVKTRLFEIIIRFIYNQINSIKK